MPMLRPLRTAVVASVDPDTLRNAAFLLSETNTALSGIARNGTDALECLKSFRPELLIADVLLPSIDGFELIERALGTYCLPVRPAAILLCSSAPCTPKSEKIRSLGAEIIERPLTREAFTAAVTRLRHSAPRFCEAEDLLAERLLEDIGMPDHIGRRLIKNAVLLCAHDESSAGKLLSALIPTAAEMCGISVAQAGHAMRYAISQAWRSDKFENQYRIFSDTIDAGRGQPTLNEMISRLADILRLEG